MRYAALILIATFSVCFYITRITKGPERVYLNQLDSQLSELKQKMYDQAVGYSLISDEEKRGLQKLKEETDRLRAESQELWDSIPEGEVIAKDGVGGYRTVGKNKDVQKLANSAKAREEQFKHDQLALGLKYGPILAERYESDLWGEYKHIQDSIQLIKETHAWYYNSWIGGLIKFIHGLASVIALISGPLTILVVINVVFSLFAE